MWEDNLERDVKGAKAVGFRTALAEYGWVLNKESKEKAELIINKISDLNKLGGWA